MRLVRTAILCVTLGLLLPAAAEQISVTPSGGGGGAPTGAAGGGLTGTYPNPTVATNANMTGDVTSVGNASTYNNVVPAAKGGAGTIAGVLRGNGAGVVTQGGCGDLNNAGGYCSINSGSLTNSLGSPVSLSGTGTFFDGPIVAQGAVGTWFVSGTVTLIDTAGAATFFCKLWDGTSTPIAAAAGRSLAINVSTSISLSGRMTSPVGNLRISCEDPTSVSGQIQSNATGINLDSTITAYRIN